MIGALKSIEPIGFLSFAPASAGTNRADVDRRIIQNCPYGRGAAACAGRPVWFRLRRLRTASRGLIWKIETQCQLSDPRQTIGLFVGRCPQAAVPTPAKASGSLVPQPCAPADGRGNKSGFEPETY